MRSFETGREERFDDSLPRSSKLLIHSHRCCWKLILLAIDRPRLRREKGKVSEPRSAAMSVGTHQSRRERRRIGSPTLRQNQRSETREDALVRREGRPKRCYRNPQ